MTNIWTDGGCRNNPGLMALGYVFEWDGLRVVHGERLQDGTNNQAELYAILEGISEAYELGLPLPYLLHTDSALAYKLVTHEAEVHDDTLASIMVQIDSWTRWLDIEFARIPREENERADRLVKEVLYD